METGTIYKFCASYLPKLNARLEILIIDTDSNYEEVFKIASVIVSDVPKTIEWEYAECLKFPVRVTKEFAAEWLNN